MAFTLAAIEAPRRVGSAGSNHKARWNEGRGRQISSNVIMARPGRFERPTSGSGDQRSIQLSYGRAATLVSILERATCEHINFKPILAETDGTR